METVVETDAQEAVRHMREAAGLIERNGLNKGHYFEGIDRGSFVDDLEDAMARDEPPKCCTLGALAYVAGRVIDPVEWDADDLIIEALEPEAGFWGIPDWNDRPDTDAGYVVNLLREAADTLEKKENDL